MSFPRYPNYKETGARWLGAVPVHWEVITVKNAAHVLNGYPFDSDLFDGTEGLPLVRIRDLNQFSTETNYKGEFVASAAITANDVLIGMDGNFNVGRWRGKGAALLNQRMCCVRGKSELITRLLEYALPIPLRAINDATYATTVKHLSSSAIEKILVAIPPNAREQAILVEFLDRETAKIDILVSEQQRLIDLLKEKRQAVISNAVTKGLNSRVPMRPSGIEWLGDVPAHWEVTRIANVFREVAEAGTEDLPILSVSIHYGVSDEEMDEEDMDRKVSRSDDRSKYKQVAPGDLVYNMMRAWQGGFGSVTVAGMVSPAYVVARPKRPLVTAYIEHLLRTPQAIEQMRRHSRGVTDFRLRLYWDEFKNIRVPMPPQNEVSSICKAIANIDQAFSDLSTACGTSIALLQERRTALISAGVTGQIDVNCLIETEAQ